jgi:hypothetical protein
MTSLRVNEITPHQAHRVGPVTQTALKKWSCLFCLLLLLLGLLYLQCLYGRSSVCVRRDIGSSCLNGWYKVRWRERMSSFGFPQCRLEPMSRIDTSAVAGNVKPQKPGGNLPGQRQEAPRGWRSHFWVLSLGPFFRANAACFNLRGGFTQMQVRRRQHTPGKVMTKPLELPLNHGNESKQKPPCKTCCLPQNTLPVWGSHFCHVLNRKLLNTPKHLITSKWSAASNTQTGFTAVSLFS